jgi:hypothetical protein
MWIKHPLTGVECLVLDQAHIERLLDEGGVELEGPTKDTDVERVGSEPISILHKPLSKAKRPVRHLKAR